MCWLKNLQLKECDLSTPPDVTMWTTERVAELIIATLSSERKQKIRVTGMNQCSPLLRLQPENIGQSWRCIIVCYVLV